MTDPNYGPDDPLPALRAEIDQQIATSPEIARWAWGFFRAFADQGFSERQALYLTVCQIHQNPGNAPS